MLIGLTAPAGSGKSEVAKHLRDNYGFKRLHAGAPVKKAFVEGFGLPANAVSGDGKDKSSLALGGKKLRPVMEAVSDAIAEHAPHATAIALKARILKAMSAGRHVVVDGVRQPAEAALITKMGGKLVAIDSGKMPDPHKPMDLRAAQLTPSHTLRAPRGGSKDERDAALKTAADELMQSLADADY